MKFIQGIFFIGFALFLFTGCNKQWDDHYNNYEETVNQDIWEILQTDSKYSDFVSAIKQYKLDSLFNSDIPYTVFAPTNEAIAKYNGVSEFNDVVIRYHICQHIVNSSSISGKRQIQSLTEKFALFERIGSNVTIDGVKVAAESPLYKNGRIYTMDEVIEPKPNLYEFFKFTNPVLSNYIDKQDTLIIDKEKSKPLGFDEEGNTVYDTVAIIANKFEYKYFPVKHEYRTLASTIVFPKEEDYREALNVMATNLGSGYNDYNDIPIGWQEEILIPHILAQGTFLNRLEPEEFIWKSPKDTLKLLNVLGDSVQILYTPTDKSLCSNGYAYNYLDFEIPDSLYMGSVKTEGERLLKVAGLNKYSWIDSVTVKTDISVSPIKELVPGASNDSIVRVPFPKGYKGKYSVEFKSQNLFPRRYYMVVSTHMDIGGIYEIYVNDVLVKTFDYYTYVTGRGIITSVTGTRYLPRGRFNKFDMWVDNIEQYGRAKVRFEYKAPGNVVSNGLVIDCVEFIPAP
jgi:uncharacterized surface protein with fasciclin (FAS1) repeats